MGTYCFNEDLKRSKPSVEMVMCYLYSIGIDIEKIFENHDKRYDILFSYGPESRWWTIEVKNDLKYHETGNVAFESKSRREKSGYSTSLANIWSYVLKEGSQYDGIYMVRLCVLKDYIKDNPRSIVEGGDNNTSNLYLMPLSEFLNIFEKKGDIPTEKELSVFRQLYKESRALPLDSIK